MHAHENQNPLKHTLIFLSTALLLTGCSRKTDEETAAYQDACQGPPLRTIESRNKAMEDGYFINNRYDCIDKASYIAVNDQRTKWEAANKKPEAMAQQRAIESNRAADGRVALEKAVIGVLGFEDLVAQTTSICQQTQPASYRKYGDAYEGWKQRNSGLAAAARNALGTQFNVEERSHIEALLKSHNQRMLMTVHQSTDLQKINWCERSMAEIAIGSMDTVTKEKFSSPLTNFR